MWYFGILESWLWFWFLWVVLGVGGIISLWVFTSSAAMFLSDEEARKARDYEGNPFVGLIFGLLTVLSLLHFGGIFDVVTFVTSNVRMVLIGAGIYGVVGILYMLLKGAKRLVQLRAERVSTLLKARRDFISTKRSQTKNGIDETELEAAADKYIREHDLSKPIQVSKYKARMMAWAILWLPDLLYHTVFQFFDRLREIYDLVWGLLKGTMQRIVNRYWGNMADRVKAAEKSEGIQS
jgi:hypothetical protein